MQRGYKDAMKAADEGRDDEVANVCGRRKLFGISPGIIRLTAVHELNEINRKNAEAANIVKSAAASTASVVTVDCSILSCLQHDHLVLYLPASITKPSE